MPSISFRLQQVKIEGVIVAYDAHGRAQTEGSGRLKEVVLMEAEIPAPIFELITKTYPDLKLTVIADDDK